MAIKARSVIENVFKKHALILLTLLAGGAFPLFAGSTEREQFAEAESFYYAGNYTLALDSYTAFTDRFPFSELVPDAQYRRALCLFRLDREPESLALFETIQKRYRATRFLAFVPFWKGLNRSGLKDYANAILDFKTYLDNPGDAGLAAQAWYYRSVAECETGAFGAAEDSAKKLLLEFPKAALADNGFVLLAFIYAKRGAADLLIGLNRDPRAAALPAALRDKFNLYYAGALLAQNKRDEAKAIYADLASAPSAEAGDVRAAALAKLFGLAQAEGRVKDLEALARRAEETLSDSPALLVEFWTNVGIAGYAAGAFESAEYYFTRAWSGRDKTPVSEAVPLYLSELYARRGNAAAALAVLDEYLAGKDNPAEGVLFRLGSLAVSAGDWLKAVSFLLAFQERYPSSARLPEARYLLAFAYYRAGETGLGLEATAAALAGLPGEHRLSGDLVRLRAKLLAKKGDASGATAVLAGYLAAHKTDAAARRDYIALLFSRKQYREALGALKEPGAVPAGLKKDNLVLYLEFHYYEGLIDVALKEYDKAIEAFSEFAPEYIEKRGVKEIYPSVLFYRGWAFYRNGKTAEAAPLFKSFVDQFPAHEFAARATYLAGWCQYTLGRFAEAAKYFRALADRTADRETALQGAFFLGKSLAAQGKTGEALKLYAGIYEQAGSSAFAPDALFEAARLLADQGRSAEAAATWARLADAYPKHALAEEALWSRAQLYYRQNDLPRALTAYAAYREKFPAGSQADASYYWSGLCAAGAGDKAAALGFWEKLIDGYRDSSFRSEALKKAADAYQQAGSFDKALAAYRELAAVYPKEAKAIGAADRARELQYRALGYEGREAELSARVEKEGGLGTHAGRLALADLAEYYFSLKDGKKLDLGFSLASQLVLKKDDGEAAARAQFLIGEYFYRRQDYPKAGNEYLKAATADPANRDLAAHALYQAALMMKLAGDPTSAKELADRLAKNFPDSRWNADGKKLIEARP